MTREKEYKLAALKAKQNGDLEKAKEYMRTGKVNVYGSPSKTTCHGVEFL